MTERFSLHASGFAMRHPSRVSYIIAEALRPLPWRKRRENAWFHVRHWNDVDAWRALFDAKGLDDSCV